MTAIEALARIPAGSKGAYLGQVKLGVERRACSSSSCTPWVSEKGVGGNLSDYSGSYSASLSTGIYLDTSEGDVKVRQERAGYDAIFQCAAGDIGKSTMACHAEHGPSFIAFQNGSLTSSCARFWGTSKVPQGKDAWYEYRAGFLGTL